MPSVLADSEDQEKFSCFMYSISVFLKDPIHNTEFFLFLSFKPDIDLKASNISISSLNDLKVPSSANVASSANSVLLNYLSNIDIPLKSLFSLTAAASSSMHIINRKADNGQPCRKPFFDIEKLCHMS